jgi:ABC-type bacteriocin/lantibiotic exporter with double-glycine peptidase domain
MPNNPPLYNQETEDSCVPACLRMVFASFGLEKEEQELRYLCQCNWGGTIPSVAKDTAIKLGFANSKVVYSSINELQTYLQKDIYPIVYLKVELPDPEPHLVIHAVVIVAILSEEVMFNDPVRGAITYLMERFLREWEDANSLAIIIEP